ncbi:MAG TPA: hypothetical protein VMG10_37130 [Gemmataceae bacterium]|nr:hypothetical protein [Gemmataceae bacterium]
MEKPVIEGQITAQPPHGIEETTAQVSSVSPPNSGAAAGPRTYAWWLVLGLVGLDCFSTLGYLPTIAYRGAQHLAPLAAAAVAVLILIAALPVYLYIAGRSPHGRGATGVLERHVSGWGGKILVLFLLGFVATDFVMTRSLSVADASRHLLANPYAQSGADWLENRKEDVHASLPDKLQSERTDAFFAWWDAQLLATILLTVLGFGLYFYLLRGFTRGFMYTAAAITALFLLVNGLVIGSAVVYAFRHPEFVSNWMDFFHLHQQFQNQEGAPGADGGSLFAVIDLTLIIGYFAVTYLPHLVLGLSGFELTMISAPLVRGRPDDDPAHPRGRIRNMRKLLVATAVVMIVFVITSVSTVTLMVPPAALLETGAARDRALSYLAHGRELRQTARVTSDTRHANPFEGDDSDELAPPSNNPDAAAKNAPPRTAADLNPLFGPAFGSLYDLSAILILCLAGASVTISLRNLLSEYLTRYGVEMHWAQRIGVALHPLNAAVLIVVIFFRASVAQQQWAYATSVLVLMAAAVLAAVLELHSRWRRSFFPLFAMIPLILIGLFFLVMIYQVCRESLRGAMIALLFILLVLGAGGLSRWMRSRRLRYLGFTFGDDETGISWEQIRRLERQVLVPHRPNAQTLAEKEADIRARHHIGEEVPIHFVEVELGDARDFERYPLMHIVEEEGRKVIRVSRCNSIAHVLAFIAFNLHESGRRPEMYFSLWDQGNIPQLVHTLIDKTEPNPERQPRVVIG